MAQGAEQEITAKSYAQHLEAHVRNYDGRWTEWGNSVHALVER